MECDAIDLLSLRAPFLVPPGLVCRQAADNLDQVPARQNHPQQKAEHNERWLGSQPRVEPMPNQSRDHQLQPNPDNHRRSCHGNGYRRTIIFRPCPPRPIRFRSRLARSCHGEPQSMFALAASSEQLSGLSRCLGCPDAVIPTKPGNDKAAAARLTACCFGASANARAARTHRVLRRRKC